MVANEAQHDVAPKTLLNGVVLPADQNDREGPERRDRQHLQRSERRAVHSQAADSAPGDEQSEPGLRRARGRRRSTDDGGGSRGDLKAVVRAILLDPEARGDVKTDPNYGRLRHPAQFIANLAARVRRPVRAMARAAERRLSQSARA